MIGPMLFFARRRRVAEFGSELLTDADCDTR